MPGGLDPGFVVFRPAVKAQPPSGPVAAAQTRKRGGCDQRHRSSGINPLCVCEMVQRSFSFKANFLARLAESPGNGRQSVAGSHRWRFNARR